MKEIFKFIPTLIVYDFDGVMTDNRVIIDETGKEYVTVHRGDGWAVRMIKDVLVIPQIILSTEANPVAAKRAEKLKIPVIYNAGDSKKEILTRYCSEKGLSLNTTAYIGNDMNDYEAMQMCGLRLCPHDAETEIKDMADYVFTSDGGNGVIREFYRLLSEVCQ